MNVEEKVDELNKLHSEIQKYKHENPETIVAIYEAEIGSILNGYREGDITFKHAVMIIEAINKEAK